jgi:hypothetical protein
VQIVELALEIRMGIRTKSGPSLFDQIEIEEDKEKGEHCTHSHENETFTVWPNETFERMTYTCLGCGRIRGRCSTAHYHKS